MKSKIIGNFKLYYEIEISPPEELYIGEGLAFYCQGWIFHPRYELDGIKIDINGLNFSLEEIKFPRHDILDTLKHKRIISVNSNRALFSGFSGIIDLPKTLEGCKTSFTISANFRNTNEIILETRPLYFQKREEYFSPIKLNNGYDNDKPLVAICIATYLPEEAALKKQINSIKAQSYRNWICIISNDPGTSKDVRTINKLVADDPRFFIFHNSKRLGFYRNFEQALKRVPKESDYVALSDQDDNWQPYKLDKLFDKISQDNGPNLVFSDMNIVNRNGVFISETFWKQRKNNYKHLDILIISNSVTGAASIFRRDLLYLALPFPQEIGRPFHDHLIACAALSTGKIEYIKESLYDYYQHENNVIGHVGLSNIGRNSLLKQIVNALKNIKDLKFKIIIFNNNFKFNYLRRRLLSRSLLLRGTNTRMIASLFNNKLSGALRLLLLNIKIMMSGQTTDYAEIAAFLSYMSKEIYKTFFFQKLFVVSSQKDNGETRKTNYSL